MQKKEVFNLEDSNVAGLGSDLDKKCRLNAAQTEKAWAKAGKKVGLQIWRIEQFKVKASMTPHGTFYDDDSYICLNTWKDEETDKIGWDIHFWLGKTTSQDEYGTAAYKTVELDDFLGGAPVQHREVSGSESELFLSYFDALGGITLLTGGAASGFNHVKPETFQKRLLHLKGKKRVRITEVPLAASSMNSGDVFILDDGLDIFQWQGKSAGKNEKSKAGQQCRALDDQRKGKPDVTVYTQGDSDEHEFFAKFPDVKEGEVPTISDESPCDVAWESDSQKRLMKLSDASGKLEFSEVAEGSAVKEELLDTNDVFILDLGSEVICWIGSGASKEEKRGGMSKAQQYLGMYKRPQSLPISQMLEGANNASFTACFQ